MPIAYTSREALCAVLAELNERQREVYDAIAEWDGAHDTGPSIEDIARATGRKECSVCARVNELLKAGSIELAPMKVNASGHKAKTYRALVFKAYSPPAKPRPQRDLFDDAGATANWASGTSPYITHY